MRPPTGSQRGVRKTPTLLEQLKLLYHCIQTNQVCSCEAHHISSPAIGPTTLWPINLFLPYHKLTLNSSSNNNNNHHHHVFPLPANHHQQHHQEAAGIQDETMPVHSWPDGGPWFWISLYANYFKRTTTTIHRATTSSLPCLYSCCCKVLSQTYIETLRWYCGGFLMISKLTGQNWFWKINVHLDENAICFGLSQFHFDTSKQASKQTNQRSSERTNKQTNTQQW